MATRKGKWVFVPLEKWETLPASFFNLRKNQIAGKLFFRNIPQELKDYCVENDVLPPPEIRSSFRLQRWIEDHRTAAAAVVKLEPIGSGRKPRGRPRQGRGDADIERMNFFRRLARATVQATR